eukprot:scaffold6423_cov114-Skeletonema_dohrnii-CCMP3373.AAC.1
MGDDLLQPAHFKEFTRPASSSTRFDARYCYSPLREDPCEVRLLICLSNVELLELEAYQNVVIRFHFYALLPYKRTERITAMYNA